MAEESAAGVLTPDFDETDRPKKSTVSMITDDVKAAGLQIKPTISVDSISRSSCSRHIASGANTFPSTITF